MPSLERQGNSFLRFLNGLEFSVLILLDASVWINTFNLLLYSQLEKKYMNPYISKDTVRMSKDAMSEFVRSGCIWSKYFNFWIIDEY